MNEPWRKRLIKIIDDAVDNGRSMRDISLRAGLGPNYVRHIVSGENAPTIEKLAALAAELNVSLLYILKGFDVSQETEDLISIFEGMPAKRRAILLALLEDETENERGLTR